MSTINTWATLVLIGVFANRSDQVRAQEIGGLIDVLMFPEGKHTLTLSEFGCIEVWDNKTGKQAAEYKMKKARGGMVIRPADGAVLLSDLSGFLGWNWDKKGARPKRLFPRENDAMDEDSANTLKMALSPDGKAFASFDSVGNIRYHSIANGKTTAIGKVRVPRSLCFQIVFSGSSNTLCYNDLEIIHLYDLKKMSKMVALADHKGQITSLHCSPDGARMASGSYDKSVHLWNLHTLKREKTLAFSDVPVARFSPDGSLLVCADASGWIEVYRMTDYSLQKKWRGPLSGILGIAVSKDNKLLVSIGEDPRPLFWSLETGILFHEKK